MAAIFDGYGILVGDDGNGAGGLAGGVPYPATGTGFDQWAWSYRQAIGNPNATDAELVRDLQRVGRAPPGDPSAVAQHLRSSGWTPEVVTGGSALGDLFIFGALVASSAFGGPLAAEAILGTGAAASTAAPFALAEEVAALGGTMTAGGAVLGPIAPSVGLSFNLAEEVARLGGDMTASGEVIGPVAPIATAPTLTLEKVLQSVPKEITTALKGAGASLLSALRSGTSSAPRASSPAQPGGAAASPLPLLLILGAGFALARA